MARYGELFSHHKTTFMLPLAGLFLSTSIVLLSEPLLTISNNGPGKISIYLPVYAYLFVLNPLNFYLNMLLTLVSATLRAKSSEAPMPVLVIEYLPPIVHVVSFATLLLSAPLFVHAAVAEESAGLAIGATLVCLALITIIASILKKLLISLNRRGIIPVALFSLFFSAGIFTLLFSESYHVDVIIHPIPLHLLMIFGSFLLFMLGVTQLFLHSGIPADGHHAQNCVKHWVIVAQSVIIATLLLVEYVIMYVAVTGMAAVAIEV